MGISQDRFVWDKAWLASDADPCVIVICSASSGACASILNNSVLALESALISNLLVLTICVDMAQQIPASSARKERNGMHSDQDKKASSAKYPCCANGNCRRELRKRRQRKPFADLTFAFEHCFGMHPHGALLCARRRGNCYSKLYKHALAMPVRPEFCNLSVVSDLRSCFTPILLCCNPQAGYKGVPSLAVQSAANSNTASQDFTPMETQRDGQENSASNSNAGGSGEGSKTASLAGYGVNITEDELELFRTLQRAVRVDKSCTKLRDTFLDPRLCVLPTSQGQVTLGPLSVLCDRLIGHDFNPSRALALLPDDRYHRFRVDFDHPASEVAKNASTSRHIWTTLTVEGLCEFLDNHSGSLDPAVATEIDALTKQDRAWLLPLLCCALVSMADRIAVAVQAGILPTGTWRTRNLLRRISRRRSMLATCSRAASSRPCAACTLTS